MSPASARAPAIQPRTLSRRFASRPAMDVSAPAGASCSGRRSEMASKRSMSTCMSVLVGLVLLALPTRAQDAADGAQTKLRVMNAQVSVLCPLTIGGSFEARTKALSGQVGMAPDTTQPLDRDLAVDLQTL